MGDIIVFGRSAEEHIENWSRKLLVIKKSGLKLNKEKCEIKKNSLTYFGYVLRTDRLSPDPEKVKAVTELQAPTNVPELLRVIGMTNYIGMFVPMTNLLKSDRAWT